MDEHPGVFFQDGPIGRRATLMGGPDIWQVMNVFENPDKIDDEEMEWAAESLNLHPIQLRAALDYYFAYRKEVDAWIRRNDDLAERLEAEWLREQGRAA